MKRNDALVVLNPRRIPSVMLALEELDIPQIRIVGHTEKEIEETAFPEILEMPYTWLWVVSDDAIVRPPALAAVRALMGGGHSVVTGYSQRTHDSWTVNLTRKPLVGTHPAVDAYDFYEFREVVAYPEAEVPTWFAGMSLTGMDIEMWREFPFRCYGTLNEKGYASDFNLSLRLQRAGIPIVAAREGFCYHWRTDWASTQHNDDQTPNFDNKEIEIVE